MSNGRKLANLILGTEVKITNVDSDLANTISSLKTRLDSDDTKLQSLDTAVKAGFTNLADSDVIISQITAKITSVISNLDSDTVALQSVNTTIGLIKSRLDSDDSKVQAIGTELANEIAATNTDISTIKTRLDSDDAKLQSLDTQIVTVKSRLDSDGAAIQTLTGLATQAVGAAGLSDSDLKVVADLRNELDSEIIAIRNLSLSYTNFIYNASAGQTSFSGSDANSLTLAYTVKTIQVFLNGIRLDDADYTATDGTTIVLAEGALLGHQLTIIVPTIKSNPAPLPPGPTYTWALGHSVDQVKIVSSDIGTGDRFGWDLAIDQDGDTMVVTAPYWDGATYQQDGAIYVYTRASTDATDSDWTEQQKMTAESFTGVNHNTYFAWSVDITNDGNTIVAGAHKTPNDKGGHLVVYSRTGSTWAIDSELFANDIPANPSVQDTSSLGEAVAISGDGNTIVAGAPGKGSGAGNGFAYIFVKDEYGDWSQEAKISPQFKSGGSASSHGTDGNQDFGKAVTITNDGNTIAIGAPGRSIGSGNIKGRVEVFQRSGSSWSHQVTIENDTPTARDGFGWTVSLAGNNGDTLAIGQHYEYSGFDGHSWIYIRSGSTWSQQAKLRGYSITATEDYGVDVSLSDTGDRLIAGAQQDNVASGQEPGTTFIWRRNDSDAITWNLERRIEPTSGSHDDRFGYAVSLAGDSSTIAIGAYGEGGGGNLNGAVYVFVGEKE